MAFLGQDLFSVFLYAVPVMCEKSTKVSRNVFGGVTIKNKFGDQKLFLVIRNSSL